jgi:hypothetical protein
MTPAQQQKVLANFRRGQAAFNNYNRELKLMNALGELALKRTKVARGLVAFHRHAPGSYHNRQNNQINAAIQRNLNALNAIKSRLERELIDLRKRLLANYYMGIVPLPHNHSILTNYNFSAIGAGINRLRKKRIGRYARKAVTKPGGPYSLKAMKQTMNEMKP